MERVSGMEPCLTARALGWLQEACCSPMGYVKGGFASRPDASSIALSKINALFQGKGL
jgi:hypothetical protein